MRLTLRQPHRAGSGPPLPARAAAAESRSRLAPALALVLALGSAAVGRAQTLGSPDEEPWPDRPPAASPGTVGPQAQNERLRREFQRRAPPPIERVYGAEATIDRERYAMLRGPVREPLRLRPGHGFNYLIGFPSPESAETLRRLDWRLSVREEVSEQDRETAVFRRGLTTRAALDGDRLETRLGLRHGLRDTVELAGEATFVTFPSPARADHGPLTPGVERRTILSPGRFDLGAKFNLFDFWSAEHPAALFVGAKFPLGDTTYLVSTTRPDGDLGFAYSWLNDVVNLHANAGYTIPGTTNLLRASRRPKQSFSTAFAAVTPIMKDTVPTGSVIAQFTAQQDAFRRDVTGHTGAPAAATLGGRFLFWWLTIEASYTWPLNGVADNRGASLAVVYHF
ncbi:MAG: hypothetical protein HY719_16150 [Planctomycetes bacterium]|nr:hypothetical protein [Planctomycetota bacterium]